LVGVIGLAVFNTVAAKNNANNTVVLREAAREGTLDAIATLNATQGQVPERGTPAPVKTSFNLRDANRLGNKNAKVTIVEFSDFQ
jgi:protein-disulfide isomerase